jgi:transcriptional regulator GlxA family with amidase domain
MVAPALGTKTPQALEAALQRRDVRDAVELLRERSQGGVRMAAACTGTFMLAASGSLDGRRATTTWWLARSFVNCTRTFISTSHACWCRMTTW